MRRIYEILEIDTIPLNKSIEAEEILGYVKPTKQAKDALMHVESISVMYSLKDNKNSDKELLVFEFNLREVEKCEQYLNMLSRVFQYSFVIVFIADDKYRLMLDDKYGVYEGKKRDSGWIYDEELSIEFVDGCFEDVLPLVTASNLSQFYSNFENFIEAYSHCEYICLRRLVDLLKIRDAKGHTNSIEKVIENLYISGNLEMLNDEICVAFKGDAEISYSLFKHTYTIKDSRFNDDNLYDQISPDEFTSIDECEKMYKSITDNLNYQFSSGEFITVEECLRNIYDSINNYEIHGSSGEILSKEEYTRRITESFEKK